MATNDLAKLVSAVERRVAADGAHDTAVAALRLYRSSAPSDLAAVVYEPALCVVAQGAKEVVIAGETHRYDPAHALLASVDVPASCRVVEASQARPCLMARVSLDPAVVGELLAEGTTSPPPGAPVRGLDAVCRLVALLDAPQDVGPLAPLVLREITYRVLTGPSGPPKGSPVRSGG